MAGLLFLVLVSLSIHPSIFRSVCLADQIRIRNSLRLSRIRQAFIMHTTQYGYGWATVQFYMCKFYYTNLALALVQSQRRAHGMRAASPSNSLTECEC